jgi:hypothetical protein
MKQDTRVMSRKNARELTIQETDKVAGGLATGANAVSASTESWTARRRIVGINHIPARVARSHSRSTYNPGACKRSAGLA